MFIAEMAALALQFIDSIHETPELDLVGLVVLQGQMGVDALRFQPGHGADLPDFIQAFRTVRESDAVKTGVVFDMYDSLLLFFRSQAVKEPGLGQGINGLDDAVFQHIGQQTVRRQSHD